MHGSRITTPCIFIEYNEKRAVLRIKINRIKTCFYPQILIYRSGKSPVATPPPLDINTTVSTWLKAPLWMSLVNGNLSMIFCCFLGRRKHIHDYPYTETYRVNIASVQQMTLKYQL